METLTICVIFYLFSGLFGVIVAVTILRRKPRWTMLNIGSTKVVEMTRRTAPWEDDDQDRWAA